MPNSRVLAQEFDYYEPRTVEEVLALLATHKERAKPIAGGTDLLVWMKMGRLSPACLINIAKVPALRFLIEEGGLRIGTLTTFRELERNPLIRDRYTALYEAACSVTSVQIKNMGTIGGNLCNASPAADSAPPLIAFGATVRIADERQERFLPLEDFFVGNGQTALRAEELLLEVRIPEPASGTGSAFIKIGRVAADLAKISIAVRVVSEGDTCKECRMAMGGVAKIPFRLKRTEEILKGKVPGLDLLEKAGLTASQEIQPRSRRSTAFYKREVTKVLVRDCFNLAWARARGKREDP